MTGDTKVTRTIYRTISRVRNTAVIPEGITSVVTVRYFGASGSVSGNDLETLLFSINLFFFKAQSSTFLINPGGGDVPTEN